MAVASVPIRVNPTTRGSRLYRGVPQFIERSVTTLVRTYAMYQPLKVFFVLGAVLLALGLAPIVRFLYFFLRGDGAGHVQSLVLGGALTIAGFIALVVGLLADLIAFNRRLLEMLLERARRWESEHPVAASGLLSATPVEGAAQQRQGPDPGDGEQHPS
jgi:hypothetical protein